MSVTFGDDEDIFELERLNEIFYIEQLSSSDLDFPDLFGPGTPPVDVSAESTEAFFKLISDYDETQRQELDLQLALQSPQVQQDPQQSFADEFEDYLAMDSIPAHEIALPVSEAPAQLPIATKDESQQLNLPSQQPDEQLGTLFPGQAPEQQTHLQQTPNHLPCAYSEPNTPSLHPLSLHTETFSVTLPASQLLPQAHILPPTPTAPTSSANPDSIENMVPDGGLAALALGLGPSPVMAATGTQAATRPRRELRVGSPPATRPRAPLPASGASPGGEDASRRGPKLRYSKGAAPSKYCHICGRSSKTVSVALCGNNLVGLCRKVVCDKCLLMHQRDSWEQAKTPGSDWICMHCKSECPDRARCHQYQRNNLKRRLAAHADAQVAGTCKRPAGAPRRPGRPPKNGRGPRPKRIPPRTPAQDDALPDGGVAEVHEDRREGTQVAEVDTEIGNGGFRTGISGVGENVVGFDDISPASVTQAEIVFNAENAEERIGKGAGLAGKADGDFNVLAGDVNVLTGDEDVLAENDGNKNKNAQFRKEKGMES